MSDSKRDSRPLRLSICLQCSGLGILSANKERCPMCAGKGQVLRPSGVPSIEEHKLMATPDPNAHADRTEAPWVKGVREGFGREVVLVQPMTERDLDDSIALGRELADLRRLKETSTKALQLLLPQLRDVRGLLMGARTEQRAEVTTQDLQIEHALGIAEGALSSVEALLALLTAEGGAK